jgi:hypothetical protein
MSEPIKCVGCGAIGSTGYPYPRIYCGSCYDRLRAELEEWKADAIALAELVESERNAYDLMGLDGVKNITEKEYKKLEHALDAHRYLSEKEGKK